MKGNIRHLQLELTSSYTPFLVYRLELNTNTVGREKNAEEKKKVLTQELVWLRQEQVHQEVPCLPTAPN